MCSRSPRFQHYLITESPTLILAEEETVIRHKKGLDMLLDIPELRGLMAEFRCLPCGKTPKTKP